MRKENTMTTNWNPTIGKQIGPAWQAIQDNLKERKWGSEQVAISIAMKAGNIQRVTARNLLNDLTKYGYIKRRPAPTGKYRQVSLP